MMFLRKSLSSDLMKKVPLSLKKKRLF